MPKPVSEFKNVVLVRREPVKLIGRNETPVVKLIFDTNKRDNGSRNAGNERVWPNNVGIEFWGSKADWAQQVDIGTACDVQAEIHGRDWQERNFVTLRALYAKEHGAKLDDTDEAPGSALVDTAETMGGEGEQSDMPF